MDRRTFLKATAGAGALAATGGLAAPAISQGAAAKTLRFVPQANLANFDPIWGTQYVVRNASAMVWDTLYGFDDKLQPQRQMVESEETSSDGLTWTFKLRPGLKFHDGEPVLAKDVVASLTRWMARDPHGPDAQGDPEGADRGRRPHLQVGAQEALSEDAVRARQEQSTPMAFIMPERIAKTDPFKQIEEYIGRGPMKFVEGRMGAGRQGGVREVRRLPAAPGAGILARRRQEDAGRPHRVGDHAGSGDRLGGAAERRGRLVGEPDLRSRAGAQAQPQRRGRHRRPARQHRHLPHEPPASAVQRRAGAPRRADGARARKTTCARWSATTTICGSRCRASSRPARRSTPRRAARSSRASATSTRAKKLLAESGYTGQPVTCVVAQDQPITKAQGDVTAELLKRIGMNVDFVATDWGTIGQRRAQKSPPGQGGWAMFHSWHAGADCINPAAYIAVRANGDGAWFGWPNVPRGREGSHGLVRGQERSRRRRP